MQKKIWENTFEILDTVKVRQAQKIMKLSLAHSKWEMDDVDLSVGMIVALLVSINENTDRSTFEYFILDQMEIDQMKELSDAVEEVIGAFLKKNETSSTNTKPSSIDEVETSLQSGEQSS